MDNFICRAKDLEYHGQKFVPCRGPPNFFCDDLKSCSHCPGFQSRRRYVVDTWANQDHLIESGYTMLNRRKPTGKWPQWFQFFKTTGTHWGAKQRRLISRHHHSSFSMIRNSTVRPPGKIEVKPAWAVSKVEIRRLLVWPLCVTEESRRSPDSCRSDYVK